MESILYRVLINTNPKRFITNFIHGKYLLVSLHNVGIPEENVGISYNLVLSIPKFKS